ncbi:hypothetical protein L915_00040 [Phytophthora nicotianae]|uniref:ubiquitinyl hydrolase 1 n=3 Tax=Phytophthora nicotianae TaxID=4792 RepID=W2HSB1_PHYNI|nr:hypothetical protein L915_00040 [Phytophthora nicotianae]ETL50754.1 hypothetical protein L916_00039 [Phytophthora nicotianae]
MYARCKWQYVTLDATGTLLRPAEPPGATYLRFWEAASGQSFSSSRRAALVAALSSNFPSEFSLQSRRRPNFGSDGTAGTAFPWWRELVLNVMKRADVADCVAINAEQSERFTRDLYAHFARPEAWTVYEDVRPALERLQSLNVPMGVISNFDERLESLLVGLELRSFFEVVTTSFSQPHMKPHSSIFISTFRQMQREEGDVKPSRFLHVGDHLSKDYKAAKDVGANALLLCRNKQKAQPTDVQYAISEYTSKCAKESLKTMESSELCVATEDVVQLVGELRRDFDGTCVAIASELAVCEDPTRWLDLLAVLILRDHALDVRERLEMDFLPQVVQILLGKSFEVAVQKVNKFLQWTLENVKKGLKRGDISQLSCLTRILDGHRRFYLYHGTSNDASGLKEVKIKETSDQTRRFTARESSEYTSRYFLRNIEYWGEMDGFSVLLDVLQAGASFEVLQCVLRTLYDVKDHLNPEFLVEYFPELTDAVCIFVKNLPTSEFYTLSRDSLLEVVQVMELLLVKIDHDVGSSSKGSQVEKSENFTLREICDQRVQILRLEISMRFFQSSSLEKRIYGLTEIVVIITRLYNDQIQEQTDPTAASLFATLNYLVDWMHEKRLMQELLGEKMHVELIKRSTSLFQFVSELEVLPTEWIDLVWNCYHAETDEEESRPVQRRHEALRSNIHELLLEMATFMEYPSLIHLVRRIEAVKAKLDSNQLGLLAAIAARRFVVDVSLEDRKTSLRQRILMHLWSNVLPFVKSEDFRDEVLLRMHELLRLEATSEGDDTVVNRKCAMVDEFLRLCLDNIRRRENLGFSLKLFTQLSALVVEVGIIMSDTCKAYVSILLNEAVAYKEGVRQKLNLVDFLQMDDDEREKLPFMTDHVGEIKNRLLALRAAWILDEYGGKESSFTEDQLNKVWELMIIDAFLLDEAALCFQWIELCMNTPLPKNPKKENTDSRALMPIGIAEYLLTTKFPTLSGDHITLSTLCCFHSIFRRINILKGGLEIFATSDEISSPTGRTSSEKEESAELLTGQPLVGLDELWQLAVRAKDSTVAEEVITLLASFHLAFAPEIRQTELPFQRKMQFLEKCMEFIATAKREAELVVGSDKDNDKSSEVAANVAVVNRCVDLLRYFLEACKVGDDSVSKDEELILQKLESDATSEDNTKAGKIFPLEHLEERLPYLETYPSPLKDSHSESAKVGYPTGRRPSWTFRQQHALLDVIVDANEEIEVDDAVSSDNLPPKIDILLKTASPTKPSSRSPCVRANLSSPQAPSPQRGPDLKAEDIDQAITDFTSKNPREKSAKINTPFGIMSQILANQDSYFDVLLDLVDWNEATSQRTWDLLCRLPTNNGLLRKMIRLRRAENEVADWSDLLDSSNIHRLLYALRLVEALLIPIESTSNGELNSGRRQWRERFVRLGGATHLYETLLKWPEKQNTDPDSVSSEYAQNIRATCLAAVMRVLNYFFYWNRLNTEQNSTSLFDLRLQSSTFPEFVKAIKLSSMLQVAVQLTAKFCQNFDKKSTFSDEVAETVYCGAQMCSSLILFAPHLTLQVFKPDSENEKSTDILDSLAMTMPEWLKALLVDCPSKPTRGQVLLTLSEMATAFGAMDSPPTRDIFELLVVSACCLASDNCLCGSYNFSVLEELFTFCRVLLGCCRRAREQNATALEGCCDAVAEIIVRKEIPGRLVKNLCRIVTERQAATSRSIRSQEEEILGGYLQLLALLASISEKIRTAILSYDLENSLEGSNSPNSSGQMIHFINKNLLFGDKISEIDGPSAPLCRTSLVRQLAQRLLLNLVFPWTNETGDNVALADDMSALLGHLREFQARVLETMNLAGRQWNYAPANSFLDATTPHVGLVNPGCICYMNSLVQQLFMMPQFFGGLLSLDFSHIKSDRPSPWQEEVEQLQKLFVSLAYTNRRSCDPVTFARSHKDMDGNSTDLHIQMDADEFFSLLLDRLEMFIRPKSADSSESKSEDFMAQCFGGILVNQILTQQGNLSEREEKFFALSVEVSKKRHLAESLELYVQGETLEGENAYFCEREQRKVSATKRVCIKKLPQTLVCHLKRFEFDYDTMEKMKINDFMEFPMEIDMFPYTSEALAATDSGTTTGKFIMYDLVGVVVHSGTSDTGHYYSFIKDRYEAENPRWLEFNDEIVRDFDVETMGEECFGGEEVGQKWNAIQGTYSPIVHMKRRSAYMLIYERRSEDSSTEPEKSKLSSQVETLATQIMKDNARYEGVVNAFDPSYEQFICDLMESVTRTECTPDVARKACQLGCQYLFGICSLRASSPTSQSSPVSSISARTALWLAEYGENPSTDDDDERVQLSKWILAEIVAPPNKAQPKSSALESQRTWLFDLLFLAAEGQELVDSCFQVLLTTVRVLACEIVKNPTTEQSLVDFFRDSLNLFYSRESHLDVSDPVSGCVLTLSMDSRMAAVKQLGAFLDNCISESTKNPIPTCASTIRRVCLEKLQFFNHFLLSLQTPFTPSDVIPSSSVSSRGIAPLAIETRSATPLREHDLRVGIFYLEMKLLRKMLEAYESESLPMDTTLLLSHVALKNMVLFGIEDIIQPILIRIIFDSESSKCDRLVSLLIGVLEEVKDTYADKALVVFGRLLDEEVKRSKSIEGETSDAWAVHRRVFSPTRGILESVAYYRDHGSREYTRLLLEFVVHRASASSALQELFKRDPKFCKSVSWIPQWLVDHLDSDGKIRKKIRENVETQKLFKEIETAFGVTIPVYSEDTHQEEEVTLVSPPISPSAIAAEDVILEALELKENQYDKHGDSRSIKRSIGGIRQLGSSKIDEIRPEHEATEADSWKLQRSREDLSKLLRIDLDTIHNNAREA